MVQEETYQSTDATDVRLVLVDTDTGVDDALAILTVLNAPSTEIVGVGSVFGNCAEDQAARNALTVLAAAGRTDIPVCVGSPRPGPQPTAPSPHGADGLGDRGLHPPAGEHVSRESAVDQLLRTGYERPGQVDLLCLGPLTNLAAAVDRDSSALQRFRSVTIMGGMGAADRRDEVVAAVPTFLAKGDTNTNHDPVATARVASAPGAVTWVGMDVTGRLRMPWTELEELAGTTEIARFVHALTADYHVYCTSTYEVDHPIYTSHDSVAAAVMLDPSVILASEKITGDVEWSADGRASWWGRSPGGTQPAAAHRVVTEIDYEAVRTRINRTLAGF